jgi:hypothetical protein
MKDNRDRDCKPSLVAQREYHEALQSWQESHDTKLEVHKSVGYGINHSKIDSYVGREQDKLGIIPTPEELKKAMDKLIDDGMDEEVVIKALTQVKTSMTQGQKSFRRSL